MALSTNPSEYRGELSKGIYGATGGDMSTDSIVATNIGTFRMKQLSRPQSEMKLEQNSAVAKSTLRLHDSNRNLRNIVVSKQNSSNRVGGGLRSRMSDAVTATKGVSTLANSNR